MDGGGFARGGTVADSRSFLSALVLAQPSPWAVFGPRWGSGCSRIRR